MVELIDTKVALNLEIEKDEQYWEQRAPTQRRRRNLIQKLQFEDGRKTEVLEEMEEIARSSFQHLFSAGRRGDYNHVLKGIDRCILKEENLKLKESYSKEEIREALKEISFTKALGEYGFPALFYQKCWSIIGEELLHTLKHKRVGKKGFMAVKLDISKAYDRVEWSFVKEIMKKMGFDSDWVDSLMKCVNTVSYSVVFNNYTGHIFIPSRGLSSPMRSTLVGKIVQGVKASRSGPQVSHLLFADDCILFGEATERGATSLKQILHEYEICSGQNVNYSKPTIFFSSNRQEREKRMFTRVLGVCSSTDSKRYLCLPNWWKEKERVFSKFEG
ncbi:reverse transcriptase [Gossypium australe]|uniref:Reverse transcriptase n=1 Tax=Gossypium australe TaxID=47621 RepID=A0A5B6W8H4_9ROSI|nr:reverse transcriptase [Gossypium australe]